MKELLKSPLFILVLILSGILMISCDRTRPSSPPNVLFIFIDDLNDWPLHPADHPEALVPNIDRLARESVSFTNAHVVVPVCGPSRKCLMSGLYAQTIDDYHFTGWKKSPALENCVPLPRHFRDHGYGVFGAGKLLHEGKGGDFYTEYGNGVDYGPHPWIGKGRVKFTPHPAQYDQWKDHLPNVGMHPDMNYGPLSMVPVVPPDPEGEYPGSVGWYYKDGTRFRYESEENRDLMPDELSMAFALDVLSRDHTKPFYLGVGLVTTHTPLYVPQKYFDRFPLEEISLPPFKAGDLDDCASMLKDRWKWSFIKFQALISAGGEEAWKEWVQAYLACTAFIDDLVGQILDALEESPHRDNTIVVFSTDHGYHIGEKGCIHKWHLWNESTRVPLMIKVPGTKAAGKRCRHPVSLVDLYPTLADLCGLPAEPHLPQGGPRLDGFSMRPFLEDPSSGKWDGPPVCLSAIRGPKAGLTIEDTDEDPHFSVCSDRYRYTFCTNGEEELYDHLEDPNEWTNLAKNPEYSQQIVRLRTEMRKILERGAYKPAHPETLTP